MTWEILKPTRSRNRKNDKLNIHRSGVISWGADTHALLGSPDAVDLMVDHKKRLIGLRPSTRETEGAFWVRQGKGKNGPIRNWRINSGRAIKDAGIPYPVSSYSGTPQKQGKIVYIEIAEIWNG